MSDNHYPELDEKALRLIARFAAGVPGYFSDPACPYTEATKELFLKKQEVADEEYSGETPTVDNVLQRVQRISGELDAFGKGNKDMSSAEKNTYFRLSVALLKDITTMIQELSKLKEHENFMSAVLGILDRICNADQKAEFRVELEKFTTGAPSNVTE